MTKKTAEHHEIIPEVTITYNRDLKLTSYPHAKLNLGHLRALLREATDRGFTDDSRVRVSRSSYSSDYQFITVEAEN